MDYTNYSKWKGWLDLAPFGSLTEDQRYRYKSQLEKCGIKYQNIRALELGFGNGGFMRFLRENGSAVDGIEVQEGLIKAAVSQGFSVFDSIEPLKNKRYDLIAGFDVLEHLTIDQLNSSFSVFQSVLNPGGIMIFRFPNADSFIGLSAQNGDYTHITALGRSKLLQILGQNNLLLEQFRGAEIFPVNRIKTWIRAPFRFLFLKIVGINNSYYFHGDVIAVIKKCP